MNAKTTIRKIFFVAMWLIIGGGMLTLLVAAIGKKNKDRCSDFQIEITGAKQHLFVDEKDVLQILSGATLDGIKGRLIASFNLHELEAMLESNKWIRDAELYFDNKDVLHITVHEKEPIARIFTTGNTSFYIDNLSARMPLSDKLSARVPVFTGFPDKKILTSKDSLLLKDVTKTADFIFNDPFWNSQVAQIDITASRTFEMVPVVGDHIVNLGNGNDIENKFKRLFLFYKQVLAKAGFNKYRSIDVQYAGQIVAKRSDEGGKTDSVLLRKNVDKLLKQMREVQNDTLWFDKVRKEQNVLESEQKQNIKITEGKFRENKDKIDQKNNASTIDPNAMKTQSKPIKETRVPKAVMPKKQAAEETKSENEIDN